MIEYIKGTIASITPTEVIVETRDGIGYGLEISLNTFTPLQQATETKLLVHEVIREDAHILFGFIDSRERDIFRQLIAVSGVGANTARMILSSIPPVELEAVIANGDSKRLKAVKGIGAKTAERVIVDLKDKIKPSGDTLFIEQTLSSDAFDEALAALLMLGFPKPQSQKVLTRLFKEEPALRVEQAIKKALTML